MRTRHFRWLLPVALIVSRATAAHGQNAKFGTGVVYQSYKFADATAAGVKSVTLLTVPFGAGARIASWARIDVSGAYASAKSVDAQGAESTVSALTDTYVQLSLPFSQDRFTLGVAAILPTGKSTYTQPEAQVAGLIAADLFPFAVTNWGGGGGIDVSGAVTAPLGAINAGVKVGYQISQEFDLAGNGTFAYRPGPQLYVRVAADGNAGSGKIAAYVQTYRFGQDEVNSQNLYQSGNRLEGLLSYSFAAGRQGSGAVYGGFQQRASGLFLDGTGNTPSQTMLFFGAGVRRSMGGILIAPMADARILSRSDGVAEGLIAGAGATLEVPLGGATLLPTAKYRFGNLKVRPGTDTGITGLEIGAGLRFGGRK